ncbi:hypothetical protein C8A03DRAFT_29780 [Achaetomium macrosporum]|uniref:Uncharacterized protein n=1 Tax=Achaetomium macrosporum TaxID=79813 RepID=A0AAN7CIP6_9PEZI|nr:hypothetical protein C8A03DRAFT_29780 [Achaetomium macrosporum]
MKISGVVGCLASAAALLGCVPNTLAYRNGLWASFRQHVGKASPDAEDKHRMRFQRIEPRQTETFSNPPYGLPPQPETSTLDGGKKPFTDRIWTPSFERFDAYLIIFSHCTRYLKQFLPLELPSHTKSIGAYLLPRSQHISCPENAHYYSIYEDYHYCDCNASDHHNGTGNATFREHRFGLCAHNERGGTASFHDIRGAQQHDRCWNGVLCGAVLSANAKQRRDDLHLVHHFRFYNQHNSGNIERRCHYWDDQQHHYDGQRAWHWQLQQQREPGRQRNYWSLPDHAGARRDKFGTRLSLVVAAHILTSQRLNTPCVQLSDGAWDCQQFNIGDWARSTSHRHAGVFWPITGPVVQRLALNRAVKPVFSSTGHFYYTERSVDDSVPTPQFHLRAFYRLPPDRYPYSFKPSVYQWRRPIFISPLSRW